MIEFVIDVGGVVAFTVAARWLILKLFPYLEVK